MIDIKDVFGQLIISVPITEECIYHQSLMSDEYVRLSFNHDSLILFQEGYYIEYNGERYSLLEPYIPNRESELKYKYELEFRSEVIRWKKLPVFFMDADLSNLEIDWTITDTIGGVALVFARNIKKFTGIDLIKDGVNTHILVDPSLTGSKSLVFQGESIFDGLNKLVKEWNTEWWIEKKNSEYYLHLSRCEYGNWIELKVGSNINPASIRQPNDGYYNRFYVYGSTRNIKQESESDQPINHIVQKRLTLPDTYSGGYIDSREGLKEEEIRATTLVFDDIYPSSPLFVSEVKPVEKKEVDAEGKELRTYHVYYIKLKEGEDGPEYIFDENSRIPDLDLSIHFQTGALSGFEFKLNYHKSITINPVGGGTLTLTNAFEILFDEGNGYIIPNQAFLPGENNEVILFNIEMPENYVTSASKRLEEAALEEIKRRLSDRNEYSFDSNPVAFYKQNLDLNVGNSVLYKDADRTLSSRVLSVEKKLDYSEQQNITIGEEKIQSSSEQLKEEVAYVNNNLNVIGAITDLSREIQNAYGRTQKQIAEGLAKIGKMWYVADQGGDEYVTTDYYVSVPKGMKVAGHKVEELFDLIDHYEKDTQGKITGIHWKVGVSSKSYVTAYGIGSGGSEGAGGKDYLHELFDVNSDIKKAATGDLLAARIVNGNVEWTNIKQSSIIPDLKGYATEQWVNSQGFLKAINKQMVESVLTGNITSHSHAWNNITGKPTVFYTLPVATSTVLGGIKIGSGLKIDANGIVTVNLSASHIPTLAISKITGLQPALDSKLNASVFNDLFEKVNIGTAQKPNWTIKAKYGLWTEFFLTAYGLGNGSGGSSGDPISIYDSNKLGQSFNNEDKTNTFNAYTINYLHNRIGQLESGSAADLNIIGSGNVVGSISKSGKVLTANMANMVDLTSSQTITGQKIFNNNTLIALRGFRVTRDGGTADGAYYGTVVSTTGIDKDYSHYAMVRRGIVARGIGLNSAGNLIFGVVDTNGVITTAHRVLHTGNYIADLDTRYVTLATAQTITATKTFNAQTTFNEQMIVRGRAYNTNQALNAATGAIKIMTVTVTGAYVNTPITFTLTGRSSAYKTEVALRFSNVATAAGATITHLVFRGHGGYGEKLKAYKLTADGTTFEIWLTAQTQSWDNYFITELFYPNNVTIALNGTTGTVPGNPAQTMNSTVATIRQNIDGSATKLTTARTIWGQLFDGSGNVSGALSGATTITASGVVSGSGFKAGNTLYNNGYIELYAGTPFIDFHFGNSTADYTTRIIESVSGRLSIMGSTLVTGASYFGTIGHYVGSDGSARIKRLTITDGSAINHIELLRASANYITAPTNGYFVFQPNGVALGLSNSPLIVSGGATYPGTNNATTLGKATERWSTIYGVNMSLGGVATISGQVTIGGQTTINNNLILNKVNGRYIQIGGVRLVYDQNNEALRVESTDSGKTAGMYATGFVTARGVSTSGGGNGGLIEEVYQNKDLGGAFNDSDRNNTFNAYTINYLHNRINQLESGSATNLNVIGSGNVVASINKSGTMISATMGTMVDLSSTQTITGAKTFKSWLTVNTNAFHGLVLRRDLGGSGSSILFGNSDGNLGKIGFTGNKNLIISRGTTTDGTPDLLHIDSTSASITTYGGINISPNVALKASISLNNKVAITGVDAHLRINSGNTFASGVFFGSSQVRTDNRFIVGNGGDKFLADNSGIVKASGTMTSAGFIKSGSNNTYMLLGGGGHQTISSLGIQNKLNSFYGGQVYLIKGIGGSGDDQKWYKVISYTYTGTVAYQALTITGNINRSNGNWGYAEVYRIPFQVVLNPYQNSSSLRMPSWADGGHNDCIRVVKIADKSWEVQFRKPTAHTRVELEFTLGFASAGGYQIFNPPVAAGTEGTITHSYNLNVTRPTYDRSYKADTLTTARSFWGQSFNGAASVSGNMSGVGSISATGVIHTSTATGFRINRTNYGVMLHNNDSSFHLLVTNSGDPSGTYNSLRPFAFNLFTGLVTIANGIGVTGTATFHSGISAKSTLSVTGSTNLANTLTVSGQTTINNNLILNKVNGRYIQLGGVRLVYDQANEAIRVESTDGTKTAGMYATGFVTARGISTSGSGTSGGLIEEVYQSKDLGNAFNDTDRNKTFNAYTINYLHNRINQLESGSAADLNIVGSGNVVSNISKSGKVLTTTMGTMVDLVSAQTITGQKTFTNNTVIVNKGLRVTRDGGATDGGYYGIIVTTAATDQIYSQYGMVRRSVAARGLGLNESNELVFGPVNNTTGVITTANKVIHTGNYASTFDSRYVTLTTDQVITGVKAFNSQVTINNALKVGLRTYNTNQALNAATGAIKIMTVSVLGAYVNTPVTFTLIGRSSGFKTEVSLRFTNVSTAAAATIATLTFRGNGGYGEKLKAYKLTSDGTTFEVWLTSQTQSYDNYFITDLFYPQNINVAFNGAVGTLPVNPVQTVSAGLVTLSQNISGHAVKLATARTIWGQSFDGSTNISGALSGATTITASGQVTGSSFNTGSSIYANGFIELSASTPFIDFHFGNSTADYTSRIIESTSGRLSFQCQTLTTGHAYFGTTNHFFANDGRVKAKTLTISDTSGTGHIIFTRASANYITAPASGYFVFQPNGVTVGLPNSPLIVAGGAIYPGSTNVTNLGRTGERWANIYSVNLNATGQAQVTGATTIGGHYYQ